jgi:hypothetical protein
MSKESIWQTQNDITDYNNDDNVNKDDNDIKNMVCHFFSP